MEEKERLIKVEEFKKQKSENITGVKRKRSPNNVLAGKNAKSAVEHSSPVEGSQVLPIENFPLSIQSDQLLGSVTVTPTTPV